MKGYGMFEMIQFTVLEQTPCVTAPAAKSKLERNQDKVVKGLERTGYPAGLWQEEPKTDCQYRSDLVGFDFG